MIVNRVPGGVADAPFLRRRNAGRSRMRDAPLERAAGEVRALRDEIARRVAARVADLDRAAGRPPAGP